MGRVVCAACWAKYVHQVSFKASWSRFLVSMSGVYVVGVAGVVVVGCSFIVLLLEVVVLEAGEAGVPIRSWCLSALDRHRLVYSRFGLWDGAVYSFIGWLKCSCPARLRF